MKIHAEFENSFYNKTNFDFTKFGCAEAKGDFQCKENYYKLDLSRGVYPEFFISIASKDNILRVSGQIDLLIVDENDVYIVDFKSNKEMFYNQLAKTNIEEFINKIKIYIFYIFLHQGISEGNINNLFIILSSCYKECLLQLNKGEIA